MATLRSRAWSVVPIPAPDDAGVTARASQPPARRVLAQSGAQRRVHGATSACAVTTASARGARPRPRPVGRAVGRSGAPSGGASARTSQPGAVSALDQPLAPLDDDDAVLEGGVEVEVVQVERAGRPASRSR